MSSKRTRAREVALQLLFQHDLNPGIAREEVVGFTRDQLNDPELESFALALYDHTRDKRERIDTLLGKAAENWRLVRMAVIDRNILRLGAGELLTETQTPPAVIFDEVIELARRFGSADSPGFVNGVLDRFHKEASSELASLSPQLPADVASTPEVPAAVPVPEVPAAEPSRMTAEEIQQEVPPRHAEDPSQVP